MNENDAPRPVRELEPPPTPADRVIDDDPTILARWLYRARDQGPIFWVILAGLVVVLAGVGVVISSFMAAKSETSLAWFNQVAAKSPEDQLKVADENPRTPLADWARLQAASEEYRVGLDDLTAPGKRETAGPRLKRALDLFSQVAREAPKDAPQSRGAAFAVARVLEARNELPAAIKQYRLVAETWKDSPEARRSIALAKSLEDPENIQFYKELYTSRSSAGTGGLGGLPDIPPPFPIAPGDKPIDPLSPAAGASGKSFLPDLNGPAGIDPPPVTPSPAPAPTPTPEKPAEAPKAEATPPAANPPK